MSSSPPPSPPSSSSTHKESIAETPSDSFRTSSPARPIQVEHTMSDHYHLHFHTYRSPVTYKGDPGAIYDDDASHPISLSAHILAPFFNTPTPSSFKNFISQSSNSTNGRSRGSEAGSSLHGSTSRSSSARKNRRWRNGEDNSLTKQYLDLIGDGKVDSTRLEKLRHLARDKGVPSQLRRYVWPLFLAPSVRSDYTCKETDACNNADERIITIIKRIRAELSRYHRRMNKRALPSSSSHTPKTPSLDSPIPSPPSSPVSSQNPSPPHSPLLDNAPLDLAVESTIIAFIMANPDIEYSPGMVYLAYTLATWLFLSSSSPPNIKGFDNPNSLLKQCFAGALSVFGQLPSPRPLRPSRRSSTMSISSSPPSTEAAKFLATHRISQFLSTFRLVVPDLANYFDDEGIGGWGDDWVGGWVGWFCAKELFGTPNDDVKARLWDIYFSYPANVNLAPLSPSLPEERETGHGNEGAGEDFHIYICIALLKSCQDALEVLEQSEIRTLLQQFPPVDDLDAIIREARRIKQRVLEIEWEEENEYVEKKIDGIDEGC